MLFDSLGHATVDGKWLDTELDASFEEYSKNLMKYGYIGGLAVGLSGLNCYNHKKFIDLSNQYSNLYAVAGYDPNKENIDVIDQLKEQGYKGLKIHPRFSKIDLKKDKDNLLRCFERCEEINFPIFLCTYFHCKINSFQIADPFFSFVNLMKDAPLAKVILVHGGVLDLLKYAELARFNERILIDLSLTLMKYEGSALDLDLNFLFENFDRRICIGSDYPEYDLGAVKKRFERFSLNLPLEKKENIAKNNIMNFLNIS